MNILVTGGTGFIGSRLALHCLSKGYNVKILGLVNNDAEKQNCKSLEEKGAVIFLGSVLDIALIDNAVKDIDIVFHLAAAQHEMNIPDQKFWDVNVSGTRNIFEAAVKAKVKKIIYGSTIGVYGSLKGIIDERSPCNPSNVYGQTKLEAEKLVFSFTPEISSVVVRIPETYGPGDRRLLKLFKGIKKNMFFIIGAGKNFHHLIYIEDLINGLLLTSEKDEAVGKVFLLGGPNPLTTKEMVKTIAESMGVKNSKIRIPLAPMLFAAAFLEYTFRPLGIQPPLHRRRMDFFIKSFSLSFEKAKNTLDFHPKYDFKSGVNETKQWYEFMGLL